MSKSVDNTGFGTTNSNVAGGSSPGLTTDKNGFLLTHIVSPLNIEDEVLTYNRRSVVQNDFIYGINTDIMSIQEVDGGTAVGGTGVANINSGITATSKSVLTTKDFIKSQAGEAIDINISAILGTPEVNNIKEIGLGSSQDGVFFCMDSGGLYIFTRSDSVDTVYRRADWNHDKLEGVGPSRMILDTTKINTYRIQFANSCCYEFYVKNEQTPEWNLVHKIQVGNQESVLPQRNPNNFICLVSRNTGVSAGSTLIISAISVFNSGKGKIRGPLRSQFFTKTILAVNPVLSFMNKSTFSGIPNKITSFLQLLSVASDGTKNVIIKLVGDGVLTGPVWTDLDTANSPVQYDTTATTITGGRLITSLVLGRIDSQTQDLEKYNIKLRPGEIISVTAESDNSSDVSVSLTERSNL